MKAISTSIAHPSYIHLLLFVRRKQRNGAAKTTKNCSMQQVTLTKC